LFYIPLKDKPLPRQVKPIFPTPNKEQLKQFRSWLIKHHFVKSAREARKKTKNHRLCKNTFLEYISIVDDGKAKLYPKSLKMAMCFLKTIT
jgi:hypothetical protein